jgi:putative Mg2+ transporter-C (MgtC) family protein
MDPDLFTLPAMDQIVRVTWRLGMAALLGGVVGFEREWSGKAAGLRTHMTVALSAASFVLVATESGAAEGDVGRVIQGVAAGVGFLGAGTILKRTSEETIQGLTTAATIWLTAAVGVAAGAGHMTIAVIGVIAATLTLVILGGVEKVMDRK